MNPVEINESGVTAAQSRVLFTLRDAGRALTLSELQDATGLHHNTLRGHLDALVAAGSASRIASRSGGRGRPAWAYLAREPEYAALAMALASGLDSGEGRALDPAAVRGGRAWGERLRDQLGAVEDGRERVLLDLLGRLRVGVVAGDGDGGHGCLLGWANGSGIIYNESRGNK